LHHMKTTPTTRFTLRTLLKSLSFFCGLALILSTLTTSHAATLPSGFSERLIVSSINRPTAMAVAPDGRVFVCEQGGRLRVVKNNTMLGTAFLSVSVDTSGERGLLGIAFDPAFSTNRYLYIYYTSTAGSIHNRVSRFRASATNPDVAESGSETILLDLPPVGTAIYHNGGALHFGPDGKLYIAVGDNRDGANAQNRNNLFGKILRLNSDGTIPTDNPFYGSTTGNNRAIWAYGLRNPFNFGFDPSNGDMLINDVGNNAWEEINDGVRGANYGWPTTEGPTTDPRFVSPLHSYSHSSGGCAIIGGCFYRPATVQFPSTYVGRYFFADYCQGWLKVLNPANGSVSNFATGLDDPVDTRTAPDGSLYYLQRGNGGLYRITYGTIVEQPQSRTVGIGQSVTFSVMATGTAPLTYQWQRNNTDISGATGTSYTRTAASGDNGSTYRVIVSNSVGSITSNSATLTVTGSAPVPVMVTPAVGATFAGGEFIAFSGTATDAEDGALPASAFTWWADLHHDEHTHPLLPPTSGITSGSVEFTAINEVDDNIFVRIYLRVRDSSGTETVVSRDVQPRKVQLTVQTVPSGLTLRVDNTTVTSPYTFTSVEGVVRTLTAPAQTVGGISYTFQSWSDGGAQVHDIATPASATTYTATFTGSGGGTTYTWEAENLSPVASGATTQPQTDVNNSGGTWLALMADGVGDYVEYTLPSVPAGTYTLKMRYKGRPNRGILQARVDGTNLGAPLDQYSADSQYPIHTFGTVTFASAGTHTVRLTVTGRNSAATSFTLSSDTFTLESTGTPPPPTPVWTNAGPTTFTGTNAISGTTASGSASALTVAFWATPAKLANMGPVDKLPLTGTAGWSVKLRTNRDLWFRIGSEATGSRTDVIAPAVYNSGQRVHIACTFSGGVARIYVNGAEVRSQSGITQSVANTSVTLRLGIPSVAAVSNAYEGTLEAVQIYHVALTAAEIAALAR
jgi:glucose/arabinose dehydrogenase